MLCMDYESEIMSYYYYYYNDKNPISINQPITQLTFIHHIHTHILLNYNKNV